MCCINLQCFIEIWNKQQASLFLLSFQHAQNFHYSVSIYWNSLFTFNAHAQLDTPFNYKVFVPFLNRNGTNKQYNISVKSSTFSTMDLKLALNYTFAMASYLLKKKIKLERNVIEMEFTKKAGLCLTLVVKDDFYRSPSADCKRVVHL